MVWIVFPSPISSARITLLHLRTKNKKTLWFRPLSMCIFFFFLFIEVIKTNINPFIYLHSTCTRSEPTSSTHPADNLSAEGSRLQYTMAVSSEQQTWVFALTPEMIVWNTFL